MNNNIRLLATAIVAIIFIIGASALAVNKVTAQVKNQNHPILLASGLSPIKTQGHSVPGLEPRHYA
jgi:hypothetical protein